MANEAPFTDMLAWYESLYPMVDKSKTYSQFCEIVYGRDLSQQSGSNMRQIDFMIEQLRLNPNCRLLDVCCGAGRITRYIHEKTGANCLGVDLSSAAIDLARRRNESEFVQFEINDLNTLHYPDNLFDAILSIDAIFFAKDLPKTIGQMNAWLKPKGILAIFYGIVRFDKTEPVSIMQAESSPLADAFASNGLDYRVFDLTKEGYHNGILKRKTALALQNLFEAEGNRALFDYVYRESIDPAMSYDDYRAFATRYLYIHEKHDATIQA